MFDKFLMFCIFLVTLFALLLMGTGAKMIIDCAWRGAEQSGSVDC